MKHLKTILAAAALCASFGAAAIAQDLTAQAVSPLPEQLRAGATVVNYDAKGNPTVLRQGTNSVFCVPDQPAEGYSVNCYPKAMRAQIDMTAQLRASGKDPKAIQAAMKEARDSGKIPLAPMGSASYSCNGKTAADARCTWRILLPNATADSTGLPAAKGGAGLPWLQAAGTPGAHIHISNGVPTAPAAGGMGAAPARAPM